MSIRCVTVKKYFVLFVFMLLLVGCQENKHIVPTDTTLVEALPETDPDPLNDSLNLEVKLRIESEQVKERVENIFRIVRAEAQSTGWTIHGELLDMCYCTESWNRLLLAVHSKEEEESISTFFDIDYWCMTRDPGLVTFDKFVVTSLNLGPRMTASVAYTVYSYDTYTPAEVDLVFEKGQWRIDNFHNYRYMINLKQSMRQFVARQ